MRSFAGGPSPCRCPAGTSYLVGRTGPDRHRGFAVDIGFEPFGRLSRPGAVACHRTGNRNGARHIGDDLSGVRADGPARPPRRFHVQGRSRRARRRDLRRRLLIASFALLIAGAFLLGIFSAFGQYYRFAAIDAAARDPRARTTAVAIVTGGGVVGGVAGPFLGGNLANLAAAAPYVGAFVVLSVVCICLAASQVLLSGRSGA